MMNRTTRSLFFLPALLAWIPFKPDTGTLIVKIQNLETDKGCIRLAIYNDAEGFLQEEQAVVGKTISLPAEAQTVTTELPDLPFGNYALAVYHDIDDNGSLNTNMLGIPTEPYAFSNDPLVKWRSPRFREARFEFGEHGQEISVRLQRWKER